MDLKWSCSELHINQMMWWFCWETLTFKSFHSLSWSIKWTPYISNTFSNISHINFSLKVNYLSLSVCPSGLFIQKTLHIKTCLMATIITNWIVICLYNKNDNFSKLSSVSKPEISRLLWVWIYGLALNLPFLANVINSLLDILLWFFKVLFHKNLANHFVDCSIWLQSL